MAFDIFWITIWRQIHQHFKCSFQQTRQAVFGVQCGWYTRFLSFFSLDKTFKKNAVKYLKPRWLFRTVCAPPVLDTMGLATGLFYFLLFWCIFYFLLFRGVFYFLLFRCVFKSISRTYPGESVRRWHYTDFHSVGVSGPSQSVSTDLWPFRHLIRVMRRNEPEVYGGSNSLKEYRL